MAETEINRTITLLEKDAARQIKRLAFSISGKLVRATPVDTGWARANWLISVGSPVDKPVGSPQAVTQAPQAAGQARLLVYQTNQGTIWIQNNVSYIQKLNEGHSKQAAEGWVQRAIDEAVREIVK